MRPIRNPKYVTFGPKETIVTFASARGELRTNGSGEFFLRNMADGRFTCASPDLERQLIDASVRAGVAVGVTRTTYNRVVIWKVRIISQVTPMPATATSQQKPNGFPERVYAKAEPPAPIWDDLTLAAQGTPTANRADPSKSTQSADQAPSAADRGQHPEPIIRRDGGLLGRCLMEALDACKVAHAHAAAIGLPTVFGAGEVERMAVSIFIERTRNGSAIERMPAARQTKTYGASETGANHA